MISTVITKRNINTRNIIELRPETGKQVLVYNTTNKHIIVIHGPESITGTGNEDHIMITGTEKEIEEEKKRLGLVVVDGVGAGEEEDYFPQKEK